MQLQTAGARRRAEDRLTLASVGHICLGIAAVVWVWLLAVMLLLAGASNASAADTEPQPAPIDVMDYYVGAVETNQCCDCHRTICY